jgi:hypoxanthine-guanine phosphoribosyltransferase
MSGHLSAVSEDGASQSPIEKKAPNTLTSGQIRRILAPVNGVIQVLYTKEDVLSAIAQMAQAIVGAIQDKWMADNLLVIPLTNGGIWAAVKLMNALTTIRPETPIAVDAVSTSKYEGREEEGQSSRVVVDLLKLKGKDWSRAHQMSVLIVDDVHDTGDSLCAVIDLLVSLGVPRANIFTAVLLDKPNARRPGNLPYANFTGLTLQADPDYTDEHGKPKTPWVFGEGMDAKFGLLRNVPGIFYFSDFDKLDAVIKNPELEVERGMPAKAYVYPTALLMKDAIVRRPGHPELVMEP